MKAPCTPGFYRYSENLVATIAYCSNTLLFYLVLFHTPRELRVYSRVLLFACIVDYIFITSNFVLEPHITIHGGTFFFVFNSFAKTTSPDVSFSFALSYLFTLYFVVVWVTVPFVYRYAVICRNQVMSNWLFITLICMAALSGMSVPVSCYFIFYPSLWDWLRADRRLFDSLPCVFHAQVPFFSMQMPLIKRLPMSIAALTVAYNYAVITWCSVSIYRRFKNAKVTFSKKTDAMHRQLNNMLVVQAVGPILLIVAPLIMMFVVTYERKQEAPELMLVSTLLSWITLLNPLSTIYFVKAYRYKAMELVFRRRNFVEPSPSIDRTTASGLSVI